MNPIKRFRRAGLVLALAAIGTFTAIDHQAQAQHGGSVQGPFLGQPVKPGLMTKDLRTLPKPLPAQGARHGAPVLLPGGASVAPMAPDSIRQTHTLGIEAPRSVQSFNGLAGGDPPDANGAVGLKYYAQTINLSVGFFDKATGRPISEVDLNTFWQNAGAQTGTPCDANQWSDPVVLYDQQGGRFIITDMAATDHTNGPFYECIAVSKTSDPISGGWYLYPILADSNLLNDYPKLGVWLDAYYMTADMYNGSQRWQYVRVWALNRAKMLAGSTLDANDNQSFNVLIYSPMIPGNFEGTPPAAGLPDYFAVADLGGGSSIHIYRFHVDFATPANSWFGTSSSNGNPTDIAVSAYNPPTQNVPQKGTNVGLDTLGARLMYQLQYRNMNGAASLWAAQTVDAGGGVNGIRWYQFDVAQNVIQSYPIQESTFSPDATHRWLPHLAVDGFGNMALGYSASSSSIYPDIRYTGRLFTDPANTLQAEATLFSSSNFFNDNPSPGNAARWGDYSAMEVDPADDCTFWYTTEYIDASGSPATRIGSFSFPPCATTIIQARRAAMLASNFSTAIVQIRSSSVFLPLVTR